jgi:multiple antibiotic resistance protein
MSALFVNTFVKIFFLFTPFFVLSVFLAVTRNMEKPVRQLIAFKTTLAIIVVAFALFFFGNYIG